MEKTTFYSRGLFKSSSSLFKWWLLAVMMLGTFMAVLDSTIVNVALPTIFKHYSSSIELGQWVVSGYMTSMAIMLLCSNWFADRFGYKTTYLVGITIFTLGSFFCSIAPSLEALILARLFEGVGSGIVQPLALALILREFPVEKRGLALGFWAMASGAAVSLGPFLGGYLIQDYSWNMIFLINIPIGLISLVGITLILRELKSEKKERFDYLGFILLVIWIPLFLYSMARFSNASSDNLITFILLSVSVVFFTLFLLHEKRSKTPLLNLSLLANRNFAMLMIVIFLYGIALMGGNYILPEYLQHTLKYTVFESGLVFLPVGIIQMIMSPISGALIKKIGDLKLIYAGIMILVSYFVLSIQFDFETPKWLIMTSLYLRGLGIGLSFTAINHLSFKGLTGKDMGQASGISNTVRQFSGSVGVAMLTTILVVNSNSVSTLSHSAEYLEGIRTDFLFMTIAIFAAIIPLLFLKTKKND